MIDDRSAGRHPDEELPASTFAVQLVLEVESRAFAEQIRARLPDEETTGVAADGYRSYVDSDGLDHPVVGASIPFADRNAAVALYAGIPEYDDFEKSVRSGTLAIRTRRADQPPRADPVVVAASHFP